MNPPDGRPHPRVEVHPDSDALARAVADALVGRLAEVDASGHGAHVALTGGSVARKVHTEIARHHASTTPDIRPVDWSQVHLWWGDDRFVATGSPERNAGQAREDFLDEVGPTLVHEIPSADQVADAEAAAAAYGEELRSHGSGAFDVVMLGVGPDGHVASLFPGRPELTVEDRIAVAVHDSPKPPPERVSLTFAALNRCRSAWFVVSGAEKAEAVARALATAGSVEETPARGVRGENETIWFLDTAAASQL